MKHIPHPTQLYHLNGVMHVEQRYALETLHTNFLHSLDTDLFLDYRKPCQKTWSNNLNAWSSASEWLVKEGPFYYRKAPITLTKEFKQWITSIGNSWLTGINKWLKIVRG